MRASLASVGTATFMVDTAKPHGGTRTEASVKAYSISMEAYLMPMEYSSEVYIHDSLKAPSKSVEAST